MGMNHKLEKPQRLLSFDGSLLEPGWANKLVSEYSPFDIKANRMRIKQIAMVILLFLSVEVIGIFLSISF